MASQVSHLAAPRNGIVPENSLPTLAWRPAGQRRAIGPGEPREAARPAEPVRRRLILRDRVAFLLSLLVFPSCVPAQGGIYMRYTRRHCLPVSASRGPREAKLFRNNRSQAVRIPAEFEL